jgi:Prokaryotic E2 family E
MLRERDRDFLDAEGYRYSTYNEGSNALLVIENFELPIGYVPQEVELLLIIPSTYPDGQIDMWWVHPVVVFARNQTEPANAQVRQTFPGYTPDPNRQWQRFSRHPKWRAGIDDLTSYLRAALSTLAFEATQVAA